MSSIPLQSITTTVPNRRPTLVALLAVAAAAILVGGSILRPRQPTAAPAPLPSESEVAPLARFAQRRAIDDAQRYFASVADDVAQWETWIAAPAQTATVWTDHLIITPPLRDRDAIVLKVGDHVTIGLLAVHGPQFPFSAFNVPGDAFASAPRKRPTAPPVPGEPVVVVSRTADGVVHGGAHVVQRAGITCGVATLQEIVLDIPLGRRQAGAGVFDVDGNLHAVVLPCGNRQAAIDAVAIDSLLKQSKLLLQRLLSRCGVQFDALTVDEAEYFGVPRGVIVRQMWIGEAGDLSGLTPGDLVERVGDTSVITVDDLQPLLAARVDQPVEFAIRRARRSLRLSFPASTHTGQPSREGGVVFDSPVDGYLIQSVLAGSSAARAGIAPGDRLLRINGVEPATISRARQVLQRASGRAALVEVARGGRRIALLLR